MAGFGDVDSQGAWHGLYVDDCRAVAAAMFGDATRAKLVPTTTQNRLTMLQTGEIDILTSNTTWTLPREAALGLVFVGVSFYDGQGFLVKAATGITAAQQLTGATVCVQPGTTTELNLADWSRANQVGIKPVVIDDPLAIHQAFISGRCDAYTLGTAALAAFPHRPGCARRRVSAVARHHQQGAVGPGHPQGRLEILRSRPVDAYRADPGRGVRHHERQRDGAPAGSEPRREALPGDVRRVRQNARRLERLGRQHHRAGR
ncbi:MAG: transporter substrate-binding domain-containing protein [Pseudomonadota bacterium]